jgi:CDP-paratose 2-epimerase
VSDTVLITGGAGFVGTNLAARLLDAGTRVTLFDNLARAGVEKNLRWLTETYGDRVRAVIGDTRDENALRDALADASHVFHFAAQVAVTSSLDSPLFDFDVNLRGTLNLLEAIRRSEHRPSLVFTSTNKVYGALDDVELEATDTRYRPTDGHLRVNGISEVRPLDFHSPYGCSKGGADQYVLDYTRSFGLIATVLRMSCIYGPHQFGNEDQGWVAHFLIRALDRQPITLYGDGLQVRDILFVDDLVDAMLLCMQRRQAVSGHAFNIGGGPSNTVSLVELIDRLGKLLGYGPTTAHADSRVGDQRYYVSNTHAFNAATGWRPRVSVQDGLSRLVAWLRAQRETQRELETHAA